MSSYLERLLGLNRLAGIYAYCRELARINDFFLGCEKEYAWDDHGHNLVRAMYLTGLIDTELWHAWNSGHYDFYKHDGILDPNESDLCLATTRVAESFENYRSYAVDYSTHIIL